MRAAPERKKERCLLWDLSVSCAKGPAAGVLILEGGLSSRRFSECLSPPVSSKPRGRKMV